MSECNRKAFNYETGQFICHVYATFSSEEEEHLVEICEFLDNRQKLCFKWNRGWVDDSQDTGLGFHITLLRGHRAVYYHQISPLIETLRLECANLEPFCLYLDKLVIFSNHEHEREFICIKASNIPSEELRKLNVLKRKILEVVDQFAIKLTSEDEYPDTQIHCSLMNRDRLLGKELEELHSWLNTTNYDLKEEPMCFIKIDKFKVKIGNHVYDISLI